MRHESGFRVAARVIALVLAVLGLSVMMFGQAETGRISGTVSDPTGAIVTGAKVTARNTDTNQTREAETSSAGEFTITNLPTGKYTVMVSVPGFSEFRKPVEVTVGSTSVVDARLVIGASGTVLEVVGQAAGTEVETESQTLGATITPSQIMNLPSLTRNAYDFVATAGNVSSGDNGGRGVGVSINGQRSSSTNILLDGAENVDLFTAGVGQQVPLDSVQEFKLSTSNFTADYGRASGGVVNVATKSGSNAFHGSAYEYNRVSALASQTYQTDAQNWANQQQGLPNLPKSSFVRNQFGYSVGGPVVKDKLFFFSNTEWTRIRSSANLSTYVFTQDFLALTGTNTTTFFNTYGKLASGVSNIGVPVTAGQLAAGCTLVAGVPTGCTGVPHWNAGRGSPNFVAIALENPSLPVLQLVNFTVPTDAGAGTPQNAYSSVNRVDFNLTQKTTIWGRYALQNEIDFPGSVANSPYAGYNTGENIRNQNVLINVTHIFTPTVVNQTKLSYNRLNLLQPLGTQPVSPSLYLSGSVPTPNNQSVLLPGYIPQSQGNAIPFGGPQNLYQFSDQLSITKGKHSFSFGGEYIQARDNRVFGAYEEGIADLAASSRSSLDAMLAGTIQSYQVGINPNGVFPCQTDIATGLPINPASCTINLPVSQPAFNRNNRFNDGAVYGTDTWKIKPRLTLNLGLRWEYFGVQHNTNPQLDSNFYYTGALNAASVRGGLVSKAPASPLGQLWKSSPRNFGPRIGFAYDVFGNGKTSIRGGFGISYERNFGNVTFNVIQNPPAYAVVALSGGPYPLPTDNLGPFAGEGSTILPPVTLRGVDPNIKTAYASTYSLAVEHELARNTVFAIEYSGSRGIHQYSITNINRYVGGVTYNGDTNIAWNNPVDPPTPEASRTNNQYGNINFRASNGDSWYNGVNFRLQSSNFQSKGLQFTFNYTWAHSEDNLSSTFSETNSGGAQGSLGFLDWQHPNFDKGSSDYDVRNRVAFSAVYTPTYLDHFKSKAVQAVAGGWSVAPIWTWRSGTPFTMYDCGFAIGICARQLNAGGSASYTSIAPVDPIGSPNTFSYFTPLPYTPYMATVDGLVAGNTVMCIEYGISPCVTDGIAADGAVGPADVPSCTNGVCKFPSNMLGRNTYRAPNVYSLNLGVYKTFKLTERMNLQFRGEAYNLFNHSNYYVNYGGTDSEFGSPVTVEKGYNPSTLLFEQRNLQLALRLTF
jgi:Carboxypeptidase regulatory-like domain